MKPGRRGTRARIIRCWECNKKLALGGWQYAVIVAEDGHLHDVHHECVGKRTIVTEEMRLEVIVGCNKPRDNK